LPVSALSLHVVGTLATTLTTKRMTWHSRLHETRQDPARVGSFARGYFAGATDSQYIYATRARNSKNSTTVDIWRRPTILEPAIRERQRPATRGHAARKLLLHAIEHTARCRTRVDGVLHRCRAPEHRFVEKATIARYLDGPDPVYRPAQPVYSRRSHRVCRLGTRMGSRGTGDICRRAARTHHRRSARHGPSQRSLTLLG
jgi:hypothetical protein